MARVLIVAATRLYRDGLAEVLSRQAGLDVVGAVAPAEVALDLVHRLAPTVVLVDVAMSGVLETVRGIARALPGLRVVALATPESEADVMACAEAGVAGFVGRDGTLDDLLAAIRCVERGEAVCPPRLVAGLFRRLASWSRAGGTPAGEAARCLTRRESEIVRLIEQGMSNKQIAVQLGIELATVKNHVHHLLDKLHVHRRGEAAAKLRRRSGPFARLSGSHRLV